MADFSEIVINTTAEKIERMANMEINNEVIDDTSDDNSLPTSKLVYDFVSNSASGGSGDCVSYSKAQNLTDEQKTTARKNIDALYVDDVDNVIHDALNKAIENGEIQGIKGKDGISATHSWNGTVLTITSASGTSSSDLKGEKGDTGATGSTGPRGEKGDKGDKGDQGEQGLQGDKGDKGEKGDKGNDGADGKDGTPATHKWDGTVLTVTSASGTSSADLKGEKGDKGDKGEDGADYILTDDDKREIATKANAVSYSEAQDLTDEQKAQARENINAVDASLVVSNIISDTGSGLIVLKNNIPNGDALAAFVREHGVSSAQTQSLSEIKKARARSNINAAEDAGTWELLYTIEGDGATVAWEFTKFADGSDLRLRAAAVKTINTVAASADTYGFIYAYDSSSNIIGTAIITKFLSKTAGAVAMGIIEQDKGYYRAYSVDGAKSNPGSVRYSGYQQYNEIGNIETTPYIPRIRVVNQTTAYLPVGSTIEVWGVKA